jgi:hypothetical protein
MKEILELSNSRIIYFHKIQKKSNKGKSEEKKRNDTFEEIGCIFTGIIFFIFLFITREKINSAIFAFSIIHLILYLSRREKIYLIMFLALLVGNIFTLWEYIS